MGGKLLLLPGEVLQTESRGKKSEHRSNNELQEVSRGHSTRGRKIQREGPNNCKSLVKTGRRTAQ